MCSIKKLNKFVKANLKCNIYLHDANGNQTTRTIGGQTYTLNYNAENQLVSVTGPNGFSATFIYDGDGRRVKATENPSTGSHRPDVLAGG